MDMESDDDEIQSDDDEIEYYEDDEDMEEDLDDDCYEEPMPTATEKVYEILTPSTLVDRQQQEVAKIKEVLDISSVFASILLRFFHWDVETLVNKTFEHGRRKVFKAAGVIDTDEDEGGKDASSSSSCVQETAFECQCCFEDVEFVDSTALDCGHRFCNECWGHHVSMKINEGESKHITCMQRGCNVVFDETKVPSFVNSTAFEKYKKFMLESYVEDNCKVKWCPSIPHCGNAVLCTQASAKVVVNVACTCSHEFCFNCAQAPHGPATCSMVKMWLKRLEQDGENTSWLSANTKDCPLCGQPVEKNGGCNLMACRCGSFFCWICGQQTGAEHTWTEINGHTCGKYKENFDADNAKTQLQRFQHYHDRFKANLDSYRLECKMLDSLDARIEVLQRLGDSSAASWDWLVEGINQLKICRRVLQWSYTWAFYAFAPPQPNNPFGLALTPEERLSAKNIFEDSQEQLEYLTERLSKELEVPITVTTAEELGVLKSTVLRMTRAASNRYKGIFDVLEKNVLKDDYIEFK
uniref:RBR-type E3 ubiquitin transferase n=2 Tax=Eutreptiella gymnastica TaxID=73025 RepID=A0A7S4GEC2_9EUGL|mmetsp:Transcript_31937/g.53745  ORF Transcript_31937/g.53745 Transcript_31937/m.53745 type:complete len:524 (-) Transcript_31937:126-1697(-)|eukprot:CAMPEP_0174309838 /NCGR_PEP_ID=MMETSP0810-20121108/2669_1 /TAXON_ID=73025 ORGANISM="Eutreptiella gymnastica-like, Strain CCMP1594" /NCGR_SAMPLE_ID=MMETSP0810 /ASSEMBLY_ACC=CAM_ASM_000659 /LENGTH=523 /DNA_ID=CAMNT_0015417589 /DNA_START=90 /DNA_END=1661 /DNA_ORIENTATION=+